MQISTVSLYEDPNRGRAAVIWHNNSMYAIILDGCFICECILENDNYKMLDFRTGKDDTWKSMVASRLCCSDEDCDVLSRHKLIKNKIKSLCIPNFVDEWVDTLYEKMQAHSLPTKVIVKIDYGSWAVIYGEQELFIYVDYVYTADKEIIYRGVSYSKILSELATELFFDSFSYSKPSKQEKKHMEEELNKYRKEISL